MKLLQLELKRVLKTRVTWMLLAVCLFLSALMAYLPTTFHSYHWTNENGQEITLSGLERIRYLKKSEAPYTGEVTPEKVEKALEEYQACLKEYGLEETNDLPKAAIMERILPTAGITHGLREVYADPTTGLGPRLADISLDEIPGYYDRLPIRLASIVNMEQKDHPAAKEKAETIFSKVSLPFQYYPGYDTDALDYQILLSILVAISCTIIAAPIFTSDYQTGADDILRCTKHGREALAIVKITSALIICVCAFLACALLTLLISNTLYGWETTKTSIQMLYSITTLASMNIWQFELLIPTLGTLSLAATISLVLLISSQIRSNAVCMAVSLFACIAPCFLGGFATGSIASWILYALPSAALGIHTNPFYATTGFEFLHLGSLSFRPVEVMAFFSLVEIPLFLFLTVKNYCRCRVIR